MGALSRRDTPIIAQCFSIGKALERINRVPKGRLIGSQGQVTRATLSRPCGTHILATGAPPNTEVLGYYRVSLRDMSLGRMFSRALFG
jgi:hypothetical protein